MIISIVGHVLATAAIVAITWALAYDFGKDAQARVLADHSRESRRRSEKTARIDSARNALAWIREAIDDAEADLDRLESQADE